MDLTPGPETYRACAEASWEAPGTQRIWNGQQKETYIELMLARPDWRALVDVAYEAGWKAHSTLVHDPDSAYRAGREDAAKEVISAADDHEHADLYWEYMAMYGRAKEIATTERGSE